MGTWFFHFPGHELIQFLDKDMGLFPKHPVNGENELRKLFPFIVTVLTLFVHSPFLPPIEKNAHWVLVVGGAFGIPKSDVEDGISMTFQDSPNYEVTPSIILYLPVTYLPC